MSDDPTHGSAPGERRLERPPSERYRESSEIGGVAAASSPTRGILWAVLVALVGVVVIVLTGGLLAVSAGLLVVSAAIGWTVGAALVAGSGRRAERGDRVVAILLALAAVLLGQLGLWWYAGLEGGVLPLIDYLGQTFGFLVPIEIVLAGIGAWWATRA